MDSLFPNMRLEALPKLTSDHIPILLGGRNLLVDLHPVKFKNMWLVHPGFKEMVNNWCALFCVEGILGI